MWLFNRRKEKEKDMVQVPSQDSYKECILRFCATNMYTKELGDAVWNLQDNNFLVELMMDSDSVNLTFHLNQKLEVMLLENDVLERISYSAKSRSIRMTALSRYIPYIDDIDKLRGVMKEFRFQDKNIYENAKARYNYIINKNITSYDDETLIALICEKDGINFEVRQKAIDNINDVDVLRQLEKMPKTPLMQYADERIKALENSKK